ncbi:hypothetical protein [Aliarcobacter cibarius]|jgi:hypothetical protein|uniref:Putative membrane protein n=1 Tax=Aliarcobacter cibarius TaxID=255507 RepID=A0A5J6RGM0_9BACT|nr:hypothetical protein [Aliarcobacter cibarius]QEZ88557.1 putative membrane protein [Aliarcobacter cibarius]QKJ26596.1 putative membrane protein [Aliarcobacter cibarius]TLT03774.1 hypothetical protein FE248_06190 [Aliarcobacter cibarius]
MVIERFSQNLMNSGLFKTYIATGFFATLLFFLFNSELFTPIEMLVGIIFITLLLKGLSNIMISLIISLFSLENKRKEFDFKYNEDKINAMLNELVVKDIIDSNSKDSKQQ